MQNFHFMVMAFALFSVQSLTSGQSGQELENRIQVSFKACKVFIDDSIRQDDQLEAHNKPPKSRPLLNEAYTKRTKSVDTNLSKIPQISVRIPGNSTSDGSGFPLVLKPRKGKAGQFNFELIENTLRDRRMDFY